MSECHRQKSNAGDKARAAWGQSKNIWDAKREPPQDGGSISKWALAAAAKYNKKAKSDHLAVAVAFPGVSGEPKVIAIVDFRAEVNFISQLLAIKLELEERSQPSAVKVEATNGTNLHVYAEHTIALQAINSQGNRKTETHHFLACELEEHSVILGHPWLV